MNLWLFITLLLVFMINLILKSSNAVTVSGKSTLNSQTDGIKHITIQRVKRKCTTSDGKNRCQNLIKNLKNTIRRKRSAVAQTTNVTLLDENWGEYWMGLITIGTPPQPFYTTFDTGSPDLWVPGTRCGNPCGGTHTFNTGASSTYKSSNKNFDAAYGDGSVYVSGTWATDTVNIAGVSISQQPFAIVNSANGFSTDENDGLLGMSYPQLESGGETPVIWSMYLAGELQQPIFSFWFGPVSTGSDTGELILGGYDPTKYTGAFTYAPVSVKGYWEFVANSVVFTVGSTQTTIATSINAFLDTGTTVAMVFPTAYTTQIISAIGATYDSTTGLYTVNCQTKSLSAFPNISVIIGGTAFTLTPLMYINITGGPTQYTCNAMIYPMDLSDLNGNPVWILGDYFLRRFYSVYDMQNNRIGLAPSTSYSELQNVPSTLFPSPTTLSPSTTKSTTTLSPSTTESTTTISTTTTLPPQCFQYETISDRSRLTTSRAGACCDDSSVFNSINVGYPTYVRFVSPGGTKLATSPVNGGNGRACDTLAAGWTNATYPTVAGTTVYAFVCFAYNGNPCYGYVYGVPITNCNGFYVHGLYAPGACDYRYCTQ